MLAEKKKEKALKLLKRKKAIEKRYNHCETNIENIQGLIDQIKETQQQQDILKALDGGNQAMKELHKIVSVDDAERFVLIFDELCIPNVVVVCVGPCAYHCIHNHPVCII